MMKVFGVTLAMLCATAMATAPLPFFLHTVNSTSFTLPASGVSDLDGVSHYRLLPGKFPTGMGYHFDGLATVMKIDFSSSGINIKLQGFEDKAYTNYDHCDFFGTGTGPTRASLDTCVLNPAVNLLPIDGQLWLTIDTSSWGRVDPDTLETINSTVEINSLVLNAHPACDFSSGSQVCYVQAPCPAGKEPLSNEVCCFSLHTTPGNLNTTKLSHAVMDKKVWIQHSHEPSVTPNYVVSKLDHFQLHNPINGYGGLLRAYEQAEADYWLVMDRSTHESFVMESSHGFVSNHFCNTYEDGGNIIVDTIAATSDYLFQYFDKNLEAQTDWSKIFDSILRCVVPTKAGGKVQCENYFTDSSLVIDYPTFNPLWKGNPNSQWWYGISPASTDSSQWFDSVVKVDSQKRVVAKRWHEPGVFVTEATFVVKQGSDPTSTPEDDGYLITVMYNSTRSASSLGVFSAATLDLVDLHPLPLTIPFHAHGVSKVPGYSHWFTNP